ncbi:hypothetical protein GGF31_002991 [Allomyces arbusculus]|nr:hypothetical protein GGF31_002991 [Allomyces arbusculus]
MTPRKVVPPPVPVRSGPIGQVQPPPSIAESVMDVINDDDGSVEILKWSAPGTDQRAGHRGKEGFPEDLGSSRRVVPLEPARRSSTRIKDLKKRKMGTE